jgi:hypothetical protein
MKLLESMPGTTLPSLIQDPFTKNKITSIDLHGGQSWVGSEWSFWATVEFKNGGTTGKQKIEGTSMDDVYIKVANFIKSLE